MPEDSRLLPLNAGRRGDPLVCLPAAGGSVFPYAPLARELSECLTSYGIEVGRSADGDALADTASDCVRALTRLVAAGPLRLTGWSTGGLLAVEVARRLEAVGHSVAQVALLDTVFPTLLPPPPPDRQLAAAFVAEVGRSLRHAPDLPAGLACWPVDEQLDWVAGRLPPRGGGWRAELVRRFVAYQADLRAVASYRPGSLQAPALLVVAAASPDTSVLWEQALGRRPTTMRVGGEHFTILQPPHVRQVAAALLAAPCD